MLAYVTFKEREAVRSPQMTEVPRQRTIARTEHLTPAVPDAAARADPCPEEVHAVIFMQSHAAVTVPETYTPPTPEQLSRFVPLTVRAVIPCPEEGMWYTKEPFLAEQEELHVFLIFAVVVLQ
jgi:hypothetical protein